METSQVLEAVFALVFVISLIGLLAVLGRKFFVEKNFISPKQAKRLKLLEVLPVDHKTRVILLEKDNKEEVAILLGATGATVLNFTKKNR